MRKRNVAILFRLNKKEAEALDKKVKKSRLNREAYLRQLISGVVPRDAPPPDYYAMMQELHKISIFCLLSGRRYFHVIDFCACFIYEIFCRRPKE